MSETATAAMAVEASRLRAMACLRRRSRCHTETEHSHDNLAAYLRTSLPVGWQVVAPPQAVDAPSGYPEEAGPQAQDALRQLRRQVRAPRTDNPALLDTALHYIYNHTITQSHTQSQPTFPVTALTYIAF